MDRQATQAHNPISGFS